jgi:hypothetical protein
MKWPSLRTRMVGAVLVGLVLMVASGLVAVERRFVYLVGGTQLAPAALTPKVIATGLPERDGGAGGLITADLDGDLRRDFIITGVGYIAAYAATGAPLWRKDAAIQLTEKAENEGLPGLHAPGAQAADIDGDGATEVLFLTRGGMLQILDGRSGAGQQPIQLPPPPAEAERWEHLVVANFRGRGDRDLLLQATNAKGYRMGRYLAAYPIEGLRREGASAPALWQRDDFLALAHSGARIADLDGDGRHEVLGGDIVGPDGERLVRLPVEGHLDSLFVADVRPDLPGLEVVALEENGPQRVFLYNREGLIWAAHHQHQEPQNAAVGDFEPDRPGLEIWCRSRYNRHQRPWLFDAQGKLIAEYEMAEVAPKGWTVRGVEEIFTIAWIEPPKQLAAAKERHEAGEIAIFDPLTGAFVLRLDEQADRLYVADATGDWREEIIVLNGGELRIYENPADDPAPAQPSLWEQDHYLRSKLTWNYYNP